jgi:hypothetical protein
MPGGKPRPRLTAAWAVSQVHKAKRILWASRQASARCARGHGALPLTGAQP